MTRILDVSYSGDTMFVEEEGSMSDFETCSDYLFSIDVDNKKIINKDYAKSSYELAGHLYINLMNVDGVDEGDYTQDCDKHWESVIYDNYGFIEPISNFDCALVVDLEHMKVDVLYKHDGEIQEIINEIGYNSNGDY